MLPRMSSPPAPGPASAHRRLSTVHLPALDLVRGLAIALVLVHNISWTEARVTLPEKLWSGFVELGWVGVQLFFVLSGFLITGILADDRGRPRPLRSFYIRRVLRIFPLYYGFLIFYCLGLAPFFPELRAPFDRVIWYWVYLSNWTDITPGRWLPGLGHFWSLAVEEQFYLVWPWLVIGLGERALVRACLAIVAGGLITRIVLVAAGVPPSSVYSWTITRADALVIGALAALAVRSPPWRALLLRAWRPAGFALLVVLGALAAATHGISRVNPLMQTVGYSVIALLSALLVVKAALAPPAGDPRVPRWKAFAAYLGKRSYAIYVVHLPLKLALAHFWARRLQAASAQWPIATDVALVLVLSAASIAVAQVTWVALERPFLALKDRFAPR
jgi:peptidoglycan/LPS O-acetylase OafA/YrhL